MPSDAVSDVEQPVPNTHAQNAAKRWLWGATPWIVSAIVVNPPSLSAPPSVSVARGPNAS